jgi:hypothetical protein
MKFWKKKPDLLVEETLAFVHEVVNTESHRDPVPKSVLQNVKLAVLADLPLPTLPPANLPKPKDRIFEDEEMQKRMTEFKTVQNRFAREREEFFQRTMSKVRSSLSRNDV